VSDLAGDLSKVVEIQRNRIRYLEQEVVALEQRLTRARRGPAAMGLQELEASMESRFPDERQAALLSRDGDDRGRERAAAPAEPRQPREARRPDTPREVSISK